MDAPAIQEVVELMPNEVPTSPVCKKCNLHVFRRKGDICYRCYQEHCAVRRSVLFRQGSRLVTLGKCCLCSQEVPANYRETDIGAACLTCFGRHTSIFKWSYDEKRRNNRPPPTNRNQPRQGNRCNKCRKNFQDKLKMTLCQGCFTKKYANAPIIGDDDAQPPVLEKMEKKTRRAAPKRKTAGAKKEKTHQQPASEVAAEMNQTMVAPIMAQVPAPEMAHEANNYYLQNNYQPAVDNSYDWYSQQPPYQPYQHQEEQPAPIPPTTNEVPVQYYPEQAYHNNIYQNGYNGYNGYDGYNGYNEYNQYYGYQAEYPQYMPTHPSWNQGGYVAEQNYGNYDANYQ